MGMRANTGIRTRANPSANPASCWQPKLGRMPRAHRSEAVHRNLWRLACLIICRSDELTRAHSYPPGLSPKLLVLQARSRGLMPMRRRLRRRRWAQLPQVCSVSPHTAAVRATKRASRMRRSRSRRRRVTRSRFCLARGRRGIRESRRFELPIAPQALLPTPPKPSARVAAWSPPLCSPGSAARPSALRPPPRIPQLPTSLSPPRIFDATGAQGATLAPPRPLPS